MLHVLLYVQQGRKVHNDAVHNVYASPYIKIIKSRLKMWVEVM